MPPSTKRPVCALDEKGRLRAYIRINNENIVAQIVRMSRLPRPKVIILLARLIRFGTLRWEYTNQQFLFRQQ